MFSPGPVPDEVIEALAARTARLGPFASRLLYFETVSSTNDVADRLAAGGAAHGTVVFAGAQESGRGRMGRSWFSPPGAGLYVSVVLRPEVLQAGADRAEADSHARSGKDSPWADGAAAGPAAPISLASIVSLTAGVALAEGIRAASGLPAEIKWPNDLVVERRKLCGILAEACSNAGQALAHIILGYGINIRAAAYPPDIANRATSLETELGRAVDRGAVLAETLAWLAHFLPGGPGLDHPSFDDMLRRWRELSPSSVGARVEVVEAGGGWVAGRTAGIDDDGALLVSVGGELRRVIAGEVRWL